MSLADQLIIEALVDNRSDCALFLDVDGTLLDIASTPDAVTVPAALPALLSGLYRHLDGALALVSGRQIAELDHFFSPVRSPAAGAHGAQFRFNGSGVARDPQFELPDALRRELVALQAQVPGVLIEDKGSSVAVHFRQVPQAEAPLRDQIHRLLDLHDTPVKLMDGKMLLEVKSAGFDKGTALDRFLEREPFNQRKPVVIGDDHTDEFAFARAARSQGLCFSVGRPMAGVAAVFDSPDHVRRALAQVLRLAMSEIHK